MKAQICAEICQIVVFQAKWSLLAVASISLLALLIACCFETSQKTGFGAFGYKQL